MRGAVGNALPVVTTEGKGVDGVSVVIAKRLFGEWKAGYAGVCSARPCRKGRKERGQNGASRVVVGMGRQDYGWLPAVLRQAEWTRRIQLLVDAEK
uniref:Uncharacterized protein n=1 Tax=mine drainage metagenome TaxID=410659 RepID=E6QL14_9ZZZZ